jgi:hypothetical protein
MKMLDILWLASLLGGASVPVTVLVRFSKNLDWGKVLAGPTWDFTRSWASNLTVAGIILNYAALLSSMPPTTNLQILIRPAYLSIGILAGALSIVAPLAFGIVSRILRQCGFSFADSGAFLVAAGITVSGLTLQLLIGACLLWELHVAKVLPSVTTYALIASVMVLAGGVIAYAVLTAEDTLQKEKPKTLKLEVNLVEHVETAEQAKAWSLL